MKNCSWVHSAESMSRHTHKRRKSQLGWFQVVLIEIVEREQKKMVQKKMENSLRQTSMLLLLLLLPFTSSDCFYCAIAVHLRIYMQFCVYILCLPFCWNNIPTWECCLVVLILKRVLLRAIQLNGNENMFMVV